MIERDSFDKGADHALMEYNRLVAEQIKDGNTAMMAGLKLQGALEFLQIFKLLAEPNPVAPKRPDLDNLPDHSNLTRQ